MDAKLDAGIAGATAEARALLWVISRAREPLTGRLIERLWAGESFELEMLRKLASELASLPPAIRAQAEAQIPPEMRRQMAALPTAEAAAAPAPAGPILAELVAAGLVSRDGDEGQFRVIPGVTEAINGWISAHPEDRAGRTEAAIFRTLGERYLGAFEALSAAGDPETHDLAADTAQRAFRYLLLAGQPDVAEIVSAIAEDLLQQAEGDSAAEARALSLHERALDEAEALATPEASRAAAAIAGRWAEALERGGQQAAARDAFRRSAANARRAGLPRPEVIAIELEAVRVAIRPGVDVETVSSALDRHIDELTRVHGDGAEPEAVRDRAGEVLARALEIGADLDLALERWAAALERTERREALIQASGAGDHALAVARCQRYLPLARLHRHDEAARVLDEALAVFVEVGDAAAEVGTRSRLADLWDERGDAAKAVAAAREALRVSDRVEGVEMRAGCHENLSTYLEKAGDHEGARAHQLADLVYRVVARLDMSRALRAIQLDVLRAAAKGERYALPGLAGLLEKEEFSGLRRFLEERGVPEPALSQGLAELIATVQAGTKSSAPAG